MSECKCHLLEKGYPIGMGTDKKIGDCRLKLDMHGFVYVGAVYIGATLETPEEDIIAREKINFCPLCGRRFGKEGEE